MRRPRPNPLVLAVGALLLIVVAACAPWQARLYYNPSDSAPRGWYLQRPERTLRPGTRVVTTLPAEAAELAHTRGYLPAHLPILKRVGAVGGQHVCLRAGQVLIDGRVLAKVRTHDSMGRPLVAWAGCRVLAVDEVFLFAAEHPASYDSRYFGPVARGAIRGEAISLWTW